MRKVKFFTVRNIKSDFDNDSLVQVLKDEISDWLELDAQEISILYGEISKQRGWQDRVIMVEDLQLSQEKVKLTIKDAKEILNKLREKEEKRKQAAALAKANKQKLKEDEKKKLYESLKKEFEKN